MVRLKFLIWMSACAMVLAACHQASETAEVSQANTNAHVAQTITLTPENQAVYLRSCANCHSNAATGAPMAQDRAAWAPRIAQGREVVLDHVINGFNSMPPMGYCADCTEAQYMELVEFMANAKVTQ